MRNELGFQLQRLANQGYLILNIVHAEDKTDFDTGRKYIGTSLGDSLYGVAEKFVDQIIYLRKERPDKNGKIEHRIWFNEKGGFKGAGGRFTPEVDSVHCSFDNLEKALLEAMDKKGAEEGVTLIESDRPSVVIEQDYESFSSLKEEFQKMTKELVELYPDTAPAKIKEIIEKELGVGKKVSSLSSSQVELLSIVITNLKKEFKL